jgi:hypothetical protein
VGMAVQVSRRQLGHERSSFVQDCGHVGRVG